MEKLKEIAAFTLIYAAMFALFAVIAYIIVYVATSLTAPETSTPENPTPEPTSYTIIGQNFSGGDIVETTLTLPDGTEVTCPAPTPGATSYAVIRQTTDEPHDRLECSFLSTTDGTN